MTRPSAPEWAAISQLLPSQGDHEIGLDVILVNVVVGAAAEGPHDELSMRRLVPPPRHGPWCHPWPSPGR